MNQKHMKIIIRCQKVVDHSEGLGGGGRGGKAWAQRRHIHESGNLDREGLVWHRGCQEVANYSEGQTGRGEGWQGMGTKTTYPRKWQFGQGGVGVAQRVSRGGKSLGGAGGLEGGVAGHENRSATATVTWTGRCVK